MARSTSVVDYGQRPDADAMVLDIAEAIEDNAEVETHAILPLLHQFAASVKAIERKMEQKQYSRVRRWLVWAAIAAWLSHPYRRKV